MEFRLVVDSRPDGHPFEVSVEPEAMSYSFPATGKVVLTLRGPDAMTAELTHLPDALIIWRPADTEVWATTPDGVCEQIGGHRGNPFPGHDTGGAPTRLPMRTIIETLFHGRDPR